MKLKLIIIFIAFNFCAYAQITKAETFLTGTKISFYPNQCGNTIPEAADKLTFCDGIDNLGVVERSYGLNDRGVERMLPNHFNNDEVFVTSNGLSIRNTDGTWENTPNIAIPAFNSNDEWTNIASIQNGLVLPDGRIIILSNTSVPVIHIYDRNLKSFTDVTFPNNRHPQLFVYDPDRNLTWIIAFNSSDRYLYTFDGNTVTLIENVTDLQSVDTTVGSATLLYDNDYLYLGGDNGLHKIDISDFMTLPLTVDSYDSNSNPSLPFDTINDLQFDSNGDLWLAQSESNSDGGIVKFHIATESYELFQLESDTPDLNYAFQNIALDENDAIWTNASYYSGIIELTFPGDIMDWNLISSTDIENLGVPMTYNPNNIYFRNNQVYFTTSDGSSGSNTNFEVVIKNGNTWSGRNDDANGNLSERMNARFTNSRPDANGGVWWLNRNDDIVVYRDANDNHQTILIENILNAVAIDVDDKAIVKGGSPAEIRKIDFPNANSIQVNYNEANDMKRVSDQVLIYSRGDKKIEAYKSNDLVYTYNLDEDWYLNSYHFAIDDNGDAWFIRNNSGIEIKKFDTSTLSSTTYDVSSIGSLGTLRKVVAAPNGGVWFIGTSGAVYQESEIFYSFQPEDYSEIYSLKDIVVDSNGKAYLLNNDESSITIIENPTDLNPILTSIFIEGNNSVLPALDHYRPDALAIDSEGSLWTHASLNTFKLIDDDFATEYIPQPELLNIKEIEMATEVKIYPNPASSIINIQSNQLVEKIEIFDILGKHILTSSNNKINIEHLNSGMYLIKVYLSTKKITKKVMIN